MRAVAVVAHPRLERPEYLALQAAAGWQAPFELLGGEAVVTPPSGGHAASVQGDLYYALRRWQDSFGDGGLLLQDVFVRIDRDNYLAPDIAWWHAERRPALVRGAVEVVPDLVVEVLSPATRSNDLGAKREAYLIAGVRELWLTEPVARTLTVVVGDGSHRDFAADDILSSSMLLELALDLGGLFPT